MRARLDVGHEKGAVCGVMRQRLNGVSAPMELTKGDRKPIMSD